MQFEINGQQYRTAKLDVFAQFRIARKLLPVLAGMTSDLSSIRDAAGDSEKITKAITAALPKVASVLADMPEESVEAILKPCLEAVSRQNGSNWTSVANGGVLMFDDINLPAMLQIVGKVIGENIGDFLPEPPASETQVQQSA